VELLPTLAEKVTGGYVVALTAPAEIEISAELIKAFIHD
jgi:hypothetical protein